MRAPDGQTIAMFAAITEKGVDRLEMEVRCPAQILVPDRCHLARFE